MAKVILINPSYMRTYGSNHAGIANPVYPILSLAVLAGIAKEHGHDARIIDLSYRTYDPNYLRDIMVSYKPDVVGITATTPLVNQMRDISFLVKDISKNIITIGGGAHPSSMPYETMKESALDMVAVGEADLTFAEVLDGKSFDSIQGIYYREGEDIVQNLARPMVKYLDDLPFPAWELYPIDEYRSRLTKIIAKKSPLTTIEFSRGCVFKCDFCGSKQTMGLGYRKKSPERCADEVEHAYNLGYRELLLTDDIFTSDNKWAIQVCEAISRRNVKMAWTCTNGIRVDSADTALFQAMKKAGCYRVHFGFESGNDRVLKEFGKGGKATLEQGLVAVKNARKAGLDTWGMYMVGLSSDTEETMQDTIDYSKQTPVDIIKYGITVPFPGTPMFNEYFSKGLIKTLNWDDYNLYNDISPIFSHPRLSWETIQKYYKKAYVHTYYLNPGYILRRLWRGIKTGEFFLDIYYGTRFLFMLIKHPKLIEEDNYAYRNKWEPINIKASDIRGNEYQQSKQSAWKALDIERGKINSDDTEPIVEEEVFIPVQ